MSSTKTIQLNISERVASLSILNGFKGSLDKMSVILEDIKQFRIEDEEWENAERKITQVGTDAQWTWNDEKGGLKDITLQSETSDYISSVIKEKSDKGEYTLQDRAVLTLNEKLS